MGTPGRDAVCQGERKEGEETREGELTSGLDDRRQPSIGSHLGQGRWKRGRGKLLREKRKWDRERRGVHMGRGGGTRGTCHGPGRVGPRAGLDREPAEIPLLALTSNRN